MLTSQQNKAQESSLQISERLFAIAESLPKNAIVCDVGSDHGYLPLYLLSSQRCRKVIVTDLNEMPLQRAKEALLAAGFQNQCDFYLTDGIEAILDQSPDVYVIAGMGGETIAEIIRAGGDVTPETLILQPMTGAEKLRKYLCDNGFDIIDGGICEAQDKLYQCMVCTYTGAPYTLTQAELELGRENIEREHSPLFLQMLERLIKKTERAIEGRRLRGLDSSELSELLSQLKDIEKEH